MNITSKEISQRSFEKNFRGYDKDEVTAFLGVLADQWDKLQGEKKDLERALETSQREAKKLKDVEESLFRTLKTAEDTGASIIEEASVAASEIMADAHHNADSMVNEAKRNSQNLIETAEAKAKQIMEELKENVKSLVESYEKLIKERELIIKNMKRLSEDLDDKITTSNESFKKVNVQVHAKIVDELSRAKAFTIANISTVQVDEAPMTKQVLPEEPKEIPHIPSEENVAETMEVETIETIQSATEQIETNGVGPKQESITDVEESKAEELEEMKEDEKSTEPKAKPDKGSSFFDQFD
ncbi:DivIVA domain-containing protein [Aquiflexum gelatinilyticum]|uniref:DivIVA domain-containing protein n=1 Tax=Aquiflexum gelatinilyticum TaxID=2961943 RepID=A0A9X2P3A7_9BACT|nr:DivIVA domain-containing protein [Aquiflexum gelatinilyticum]MCR9013786.1 DivIVA domain-containing protein [Aquiflexum gelatinilyticum]